MKQLLYRTGHAKQSSKAQEAIMQALSYSAMPVYRITHHPAVEPPLLNKFQSTTAYVHILVSTTRRETRYPTLMLLQDGVAFIV